MFAAVCAGADLASQTKTGSALIVTVGVAGGSLLWWLALTSGAGFARRALGEHPMRLINRISGGLIMIFGVLAFASGVRGWL